MRVVVMGREGQLGTWLERLAGSSPELTLVRSIGIPDLDLLEPGSGDRVFELLGGGRPDVLFNASAFTAVDACETETRAAERLNVEAPGELAARCRREGVGFVHVSTDFVFDGGADRPYREDDPTAPASAYGRTKLLGEGRVFEAHPEALVARTSWVFGPGKNFPSTMVRQAELRRRGEVDAPLRVVDDQHGRPTYAADLARGLYDLARRSARGIVHLSNEGEATWWDLARATLDLAGYRDLPIERIGAKDYPRPAATPMYSVLDLSRARELGVRLRSWRDALADYLGSEDGPADREAA